MALITTIHGEMDELELEKREGTEETSRELVNWVEYWYNNELVHRSVHMFVKEGVDVFADAAVLQ